MDDIMEHSNGTTKHVSRADGTVLYARYYRTPGAPPRPTPVGVMRFSLTWVLNASWRNAIQRGYTRSDGNGSPLCFARSSEEATMIFALQGVL